MISIRALAGAVLGMTIGIGTACSEPESVVECREPGEPVQDACSGFQPTGSALVLSEAAAVLEEDGRVRIQLTQSTIDTTTEWTLYVDPCAVESIPFDVEVGAGVEGTAACGWQSGETGGMGETGGDFGGEIVAGHVRIERMRDGCIGGRLEGIRVDECGLIDGGFDVALE